MPGHTAFHQCLKVTDGGATFFFAGDLVPTAAHVGLDAIMSYDLFPAETLDNKRKIFARALAGDWVLGFSHDPFRFFGKIAPRRAGDTGALGRRGAAAERVDFRRRPYL